MSRYIDEDHFISNLYSHADNDGYICFPVDELEKMIKAEPTANVREVVHGEWIKYGDKYKCNKCFATMPINPINPNLKARFCYFCGANMQKGETNE